MHSRLSVLLLVQAAPDLPAMFVVVQWVVQQYDQEDSAWVLTSPTLQFINHGYLVIKETPVNV